MKPNYAPNKFSKLENGLPTEGFGIFKYKWYSFCSMHRCWNAECIACRTGGWRNCTMLKLSNYVYDHDPKLWRWWANRPSLTPIIKSFFKKK